MQADGTMSKSEAAKSRYDYLRRQNRCVWCGDRDAYTENGRALCGECAGKQRERYAEHPEKRKKQIAEYQRERKRKLADAGLCIRCGKAEPRPGLKSCDRCLGHYRRDNTKKVRKPALPGMCSRCRSKPVVEGRRLCADCYESVCRGLEKARAVSAANNAGHLWRKYWEEKGE